MKLLPAIVLCCMVTVMSLTPLFIYAQPVSNTNEPGGIISGPNEPNESSDGGVVLQNPLGNTTLIGLFQSILDVVMIFALPIIVFFIIFAGFQYVTARGNPEAIGKANKALLYAVIGGVLILGAEVLLAIIKSTVDAIGA